jgi:hypothetical protein
MAVSKGYDMNINIQQAILASFLWSNDMSMDTKDAFQLNQHLFTGDRYLIASKINEVTNTEDRFYGILNLELQNTSPDEWLNISTQTPLPFSYAKKMHDKMPDNRNDLI